MHHPRIQVLLNDVELTPIIGQVLRRLGAEIELARFPLEARKPQPLRPVDVRLILTDDAGLLTEHAGRSLRDSYDAEPCATLIVSARWPAPATRIESSFGDRAIQVVADPSIDELTGRLTAMCELRKPWDALRNRLHDMQRRDVDATAELSRLADERKLAGAIQRGLLPKTLPLLKDAELETLSRPVDLVSGDLLDVRRLDSERVVLFLADATGHGVAAALLGAFARQTLVTFERDDPDATPDQVLSQLNEALCRADLEDCHFLSAFYGVYHERARSILWARGGAPPPILAMSDGGTTPMLSKGPLIGVEPHAQFELSEQWLRPGEALILHTDGLSDFLTRVLPDSAGGGLSPVAHWYGGMGLRDRRDPLKTLDSLLNDGHRRGLVEDDVTVLTLEMNESVPLTDPDQSCRDALVGTYL